ncbi:proton extrusion protein PcxA [Nostoc sp. 'Lobaria pulmonaria (5183) cyanobiont']|uniref:proton extrusion protein PcxA n=1 Tax=Nostoc sp. 'Lobaria pulmonaria (5183) cyanobiont' TaxID=1618022 RepID=UPI000CF30C38|nr:proton extrusion protein PcxA [Nostoc sp. 'Lobaria pulmonaria (5183) cyanobiont']AVH72141.1 chloroplast envelope membrane protein CemA [Nostoc sp. 'Lobaria pulmonaria (5183) cyanobiont']
MKNSLSRTAELLRQNFQKSLRSLNRWFSNTPERALLEAYQAAQRIKNIENEHFDNKKISLQSVKYTENVMSYWQVYLNKNLTIIKIRLAEFHLSRGIVNISNSVLLEKLKVIDEVVEKYAIKDEIINNTPLGSNYQPLNINDNKIKKQLNSSNITQVNAAIQKPRLAKISIGRRINKIQADFAPQTEEEFVRNYRISKGRTIIALRFLIVLIVVPLLTQYLSKEFIVTPILERVRGDNTTKIFINSDMEKEALHELHNFQEELRFEYFIHQAPPLSSELTQEKIKSKAIEISEEFSRKTNSSISNAFADLISLFAFGIVIAMSKREIVILKSFMDTIVSGLSDSAKAFLIILFTDIFVGFHSPDGWEVLLAGFAEHLGLPASRNVIFFFIATFPVILNTIFKYWIFRYLSRLSPSALATLKEMDE